MTGAVNQQERPGFEQWVVGFVDGEGSFTVSVFRQRSARIGWQVQPELVVVQSAHSVRVLEELQHYFGCGRVGIYARTDNHRGPMARWAVRSRRELTDRVVPFFEENPLRTEKAGEFVRFARVVEAHVRWPSFDGGRHGRDRADRRTDELPEAVSIPGILRGHTPAPRFDSRGEDMVQAVRRRAEHLSEIPCRVSSDLHEWRNDFPTVSTTDPAKLKYE